MACIDIVIRTDCNTLQGYTVACIDIVIRTDCNTAHAEACLWQASARAAKQARPKAALACYSHAAFRSVAIRANHEHSDDSSIIQLQGNVESHIDRVMMLRVISLC